MAEHINPREKVTPDEEPKPPEARQVNPFRIVRRGEDTVVDDDIVFADFSVKQLPADVPEEEVADIPKDGSVPEPAPSQESPPKTAQRKSGTSAQASSPKRADTQAAASDAG